MNAFYKLACALVAWSALSMSDGALAAQPLSSLPMTAFQMSQEHPERFSFVRPGVDLSQYRGVMLAPLSFIAASGADWQLQRASADHPLEQHFRLVMSEALQAQGLSLAAEPASDILCLKLALAHPADPALVAASLDLNRLTDGVAHYLSQVQIVGEVADSHSGLLLAGVAQLGQTPHSGGKRSDMTALLDDWSLASASRLAQALGRDQA
ncbi:MULTISPECIES: DUF3313 family protein [unclassified Paludibacterium]|uniref:DUF3313 family protein n=1 Tax=unclassified Paludibacterium TaxID=2618429 RepID=UPI001C047242|nr:DUF3313 family protein [Paludibacterium sp. B53371]BEV73461.1 hypothetical protein THUN1379_29430 [Paludibacterium sp. THUN1379]